MFSDNGYVAQLIRRGGGAGASAASTLSPYNLNEINGRSCLLESILIYVARIVRSLPRPETFSMISPFLLA